MRKFYLFIHAFGYKAIRFFTFCHTRLKIWGNKIEHGSYKIVGTPIFDTSRDGRIVFGEKLCMNNGLMSNQIGYNTPCILRAEKACIFIGNNVGMSQTTLIAKNADITIGDNVKLGGGVKIYTTDFHCLDFVKRREPKIDMVDRKCENVTIGDDCFVGAGSIILKGVTIGDRSIIGAGSVVTKSLPADCIAAGNPCRIIRMIGHEKDAF